MKNPKIQRKWDPKGLTKPRLVMVGDGCYSIWPRSNSIHVLRAFFYLHLPYIFTTVEVSHVGSRFLGRQLKPPKTRSPKRKPLVDVSW